MITVSDLLYAKLKMEHLANAPEFTLNPLPPSKFGSFAGIPIRSNPLFPYDQNCKNCDGQGDGGDLATYCPQCHGAGKVKIIGVMQQGSQTIILVEHYPPAFLPRWPASHNVVKRAIPYRSDYPVAGAFQ
jgi:hypothetical protein